MKGRLDKRIEIKKVVETRVNGKPVYEDDPFHNCWCEIQQLYGKELYEAINIKLENTLIFKVRYCKLLEKLQEKAKYKVIFNGHTYELYYADFAKEYKKYVLLKCNLIS